VSRRGLWMSLLLALAPATGAARTKPLPEAFSGAETASWGGAYGPLAVNVHAPAWNPAGLGFLPATEVSAQRAGAFAEGLSQDQFAAVRARHGRGLGVAVDVLGTGSVDATDENGERLGDFALRRTVAALSWGRTAGPRFAWGVTGKATNVRLADASGRGLAVDVGTLYKWGDRTSLSAVLADAGRPAALPGDERSLAGSLRVGAAHRPMPRLSLAVEGEAARDGRADLRAGVEWRPAGRLSLRAGHRTDGAGDGFTLGFGMDLPAQTFSYAWRPLGGLGGTHSFAVRVRLGRRPFAPSPAD
jgi:hypothetical protein